MDLALYNLQWLMSPKSKANQTKPNQVFKQYLTSFLFFFHKLNNVRVVILDFLKYICF